MPVKFTDYAPSTDTIVIKSITLYLADKRFYTDLAHSEIGLNYELLFRNKNRDTIVLSLYDSLLSDYNICALYNRDTVGWVSLWNPESLRIPPKQTATVLLSNIGLMGGAVYTWERLFPRKNDYTADILHILPNIEIYYKNQLLLPSKDITITVSNYKDGWWNHVLHRIVGDPYSTESIVY